MLFDVLLGKAFHQQTIQFRADPGTLEQAITEVFVTVADDDITGIISEPFDGAPVLHREIIGQTPRFILGEMQLQSFDQEICLRIIGRAPI